MGDVQRLNPLSLPLFGERLIEASAGTGKTFTLAALYLRLLLGLGQQAAFHRSLAVDEILVVTFTEAATNELRERIRRNIHELRHACVRGSSEDPLLKQLLLQITDNKLAADLLLAAERRMDEAAIYTIHGFCQRTLTNNAFESGVLFEQTLIQDELPLHRQAVADFWRRYCYPLPSPIVKMILKYWSIPDDLLSELKPYLQGELPRLRLSIDNDEQANMALIVHYHQEIIEKIDTVKQQWLVYRQDIEIIINQSAVDKRSYSSRNLANWLSQVTEWASTPTESYELVKTLSYFRQSHLITKTKSGESPQHNLFVIIDKLYDSPLSIKELIISLALKEVRNAVQQEKQKHALLGYDDMLARLAQALNDINADNLAAAISKRYPVALIDEFQDTDPQQYQIFHRIYGGRHDTGLLLIGDPKQAIYAFRGADIFTYMHARTEVNDHYTLDTNWRSSPPLVNGVNQLFSRLPMPFIFEQIPFLPVKAAVKNQTLRFELNQQCQPAIQYWHVECEGISLSDYQHIMAQQCAAQIRNWLSASQQQAALLWENEISRPITANDIAILVRTGREATIMREALTALGIPSVYLSNRDSVFRTSEAMDILWLLQAVLTPESEHRLRSALACRLIGLNTQQIYALNQDEQAWDQLVIEFTQYRQCWIKRGVLPMLQAVLLKRQLAEQILADAYGERRLTDILHIGELLQEASLQLESPNALVRWLIQQIEQPNDQADNQQLRLESDHNLVQIITIHKSKGLEYPLVWLPFISHYRQQKQGLYHDREDFHAILDLSGNDEALELAEQERLAEDLRLLYVAVTRAIYHCSIGVAPLFYGNRKKSGNSDFHRSALGYLLQQGKAADSQTLQTNLLSLTSDNVWLTTVKQEDNLPWQPNLTEQNELTVARFNRRVNNDWQVTSYSGLQQRAKYNGSPVSENMLFLSHFDIDALGENHSSIEVELSAFTFPKGASPGTFLHNLLETINFNEPINQTVLAQHIQQFGLAEEWLSVMTDWLTTIFQTPLNDQGLTLSSITPQQRLTELQFYLPINSLLQAQQLNNVICREDPLSAMCPPLNFQQVKGMLTGFIDLVFCWQDRYYIVDFKSNWLGGQPSDYNQNAMTQAIINHRYDLQYQLYTLALHRYLRHRLPNYQYQQHFGGVFYLFLRGMNPLNPGHGVFFCYPKQTMIERMDHLFSGELLTC